MSTMTAMMERQARGSVFDANLLSLQRYRPFRIAPGSGARPGEPLPSDWDSNRAVKEGMKVSSVLASMIGRIAEKGASVSWWEWERQKSGRVKKKRLVKFLECPRKDGSVSRFQMMEEALTYLLLNGNALFGIWWDGGRTYRLSPREVQVENPHGCSPIPDRKKRIRGYEWVDSAITGPGYWDARDIVHVMGRPDPTNPYWGWSIVEALAITIDADVAARKMNLRRFRRFGYPGTIIIDEDIDNAIDRQNLEERLNARAETYMGAFMVLGGRQSIEKQSPLTEVQLGLFKAMANHRDEIAVALGFHPSIFSSDASTMNNMFWARKMEWKNVVLKNARIADAFTRKVIPPGFAGERWFAPDYAEVEELQDLDGKIDRFAKLVSHQVPVDEAALATELPITVQVGGDVAWVPGNFVPKNMVLDGTVAAGGATPEGGGPDDQG